MTTSRPSVRRSRRTPLSTVAGLVCVALVSACGSDPDIRGGSADRSGDGSSDVVEADGSTPRLVVTHDGGLSVLDAGTLEVEHTTDLEGFTRVNPAGDGRHVMVSTGEEFRVLDTGAWTEPHGDHSHSYTSDPRMTDVSFEAPEPGHVVHHAGRTVLFADGTGRVETFDPQDLADGRPTTAVHESASAHHGVAVRLEDGSMLTTVGDEDGATGVQLLDPRGDVVAERDDCPGTHGEAVAADETVVVGCEDGMLVLRDGRFSKVQSPDAYGRMGNQAGSPDSPVVLGDYKTDADAELERPEQVALVDTAAGALRLVDLGTSYSFRSLGRGPAGEGLVLGTDGRLHTIDVTSGRVVRSTAVVEPWTEPEDWQAPRPTLFVQDGTAYVTEPASRSLTAVDVTSGEVLERTELDHEPNELTGVAG